MIAELYSSHCPQCMIIEQMMNKNKIEFEVIDDEDNIRLMAGKNNISSMPFADMNGVVMEIKELREYIKKGNPHNVYK